MSYDVKCYELAKAFISDYPPHGIMDTEKIIIPMLAQRIQHEIEEFLNEYGFQP